RRDRRIEAHGRRSTRTGATERGHRRGTRVAGSRELQSVRRGGRGRRARDSSCGSRVVRCGALARSPPPRRLVSQLASVDEGAAFRSAADAEGEPSEWWRTAEYPVAAASET